MTGAARCLVATLCGLVLAAIVHLAVVLAIPAFARNDASRRLMTAGASPRSRLIASPGAASGLPFPDPATAVGACSYRLGDGPVRFALKTGDLFQSLSFHLPGGGVFFALSDKAGIRDTLEVVLLTRAQLDELLAREDEDEPSRDLRVVAPHPDGVAILRTLAAFPSQREEARTLAAAMTCAVEAMPKRAL